MNKNFIYVKNSEVKDKLVARGCILLQQTGGGIYVLANKAGTPLEFAEGDTWASEIVYSDSLSF